jgi:hypothetical protein
MTHSRKVVAMLACCVAASTVLVGHASAGRIFQESYHDEGSLVHENFCGAAGLTVSDEFVIEGKVRAVAHGPDGQTYFLDKFKETSVVTNLASDKVVTLVLTVVSKDMTVTDNGDGTLTILVLATGNVVLYGANGKAIARDPGQIRFEILIDHGGTPTDPFDDEFITELGNVKPSTGRNDDLCAAAVAALS